MEYEEEELSLVDVLYIILRKLPVIILCTIVAAAITFSSTMMFVEPKYQSRGKLYVSSSSQTAAASAGNIIAYNDVLTSQKLVNTYIEILRSDSFLQTVSEDIGAKYTYSQIGSMLSMSSVNETELLEITVTCPDPYYAYRIASSIIKNSADEIERVVDGGSVRIIDNATTPTNPSSPNVYKNVAIGAALGLVLSAAAVFVLELLNTNVKQTDDMQEKYGIPVIGEIPWATSVSEN